MQLLRQSTATTVYVGPVLDSSGAAVTTAVVGDFRLVKNGTAATLSGATVTHDANGYYTIALTTGNTDTAGRLTLAVGNTAMAMSTHRYSVLLPSVFDALVTNATNTTGGLATATGAIAALAGTIATSTNITSASGVTLAATTHTGAVIPTVSTVTNGVTVSTNNDKTGYVLSASGLASITSWTVAITGNITGNLSGSVGSVTGAVGSVTSGVAVSSIGANVITATSIAASALDGKGNWNVGKTGYSLTQSFPTNFASLSIDVSGRVLLQPTQTGVTIPTVTTVTNRVTANADRLAGQVVTAAAGVDFPAVVASQVTLEDTLDAATNASNTAGKLDTALELDGLAYRFTTAALINAPAGGGGGGGDPWATDLVAGAYTGDEAGAVMLEIKAKTDLITSETVFLSSDASNGSTIIAYKDEVRTVTVPLDENITTKTVKFCVEDEAGDDVFTLPNASITKTSTTFAFNTTTALTGQVADYTWSLRDITGGMDRVISKGVLSVQNAASADA
jgi:hypothetical protein